MEQVFFNVPLFKLEPIFKNWMREVQAESQTAKIESTPPQDELLTIQQASELLNLSVPTLYSKVSKGELPVMKRSKRLYFSRTELIEYLKAGKRKSSAEIEAEADAYLSNKKSAEL